MLVLSRKLGEKIVFPGLGITLEVIGVAGNRVRLGISAPEEIRVLRAELVDDFVPIPNDSTDQLPSALSAV